jgi:hypothetical protein
MERTREQFAAAIGFAATVREPDCWHVERIEPPGLSAPAGPGDPSRSRALALWRRRLARQPLPAGYRISRI